MGGVMKAGPPKRWLYPFSARSGSEGTYVWIMKNGEEEPVSLKAYTRAIRSRRLASNAWWLTTNYRRIGVEDFVYIYTGDEDAGIVGFAIVRDVHEPFDYRRAEIDLRIDFALSKELIDRRPIPAHVIRNWLHDQKRAVENITAFSRQLDQRLREFKSHRRHLALDEGTNYWRRQRTNAKLGSKRF